MLSEKNEIAVPRNVSRTNFHSEMQKRGLPEFSNYNRSVHQLPFSGKELIFANGDSYVETQIFGELTLKDVASFEFTKTPPDFIFMQLLKSYGIEVIDLRSGIPTPYVAIE